MLGFLFLYATFDMGIWESQFIPASTHHCHWPLEPTPWVSILALPNYMHVEVWRQCWCWLIRGLGIVIPLILYSPVSGPFLLLRMLKADEALEPTVFTLSKPGWAGSVLPASEPGRTFSSWVTATPGRRAKGFRIGMVAEFVCLLLLVLESTQIAGYTTLRGSGSRYNRGEKSEVGDYMKLESMMLLLVVCCRYTGRRSRI